MQILGKLNNQGVLYYFKIVSHLRHIIINDTTKIHIIQTVI